MNHRRTPVGKASMLPGWVMVLSAIICLGAAVFYVSLKLGDVGHSDVDRGEPVAATTRTPSSTPAPTETTPTQTESAKPTPTPTPTSPSPSATPAPPQRDVEVGVFNNTRRGGLAAGTAARIRAAGWSVSGVGNWRGAIPQTTIYYPAGQIEQAKQLGKDIGIPRLRPAISSMRSDRLTVILAGTQ